MNDRYKELAREAASWCEQYAKGTPVAWEWEQKFAELVVNECMQQVGSLMDREFNDSLELEALLTAHRAIREHFGIK